MNGLGSWAGRVRAYYTERERGGGYEEVSGLYGAVRCACAALSAECCVLRVCCP